MRSIAPLAESTLRLACACRDRTTAHNCEVKLDQKKNLRLPIAIYADFEARNALVGEEITDDKRTAKRTEHRIISGAF